MNLTDGSINCGRKNFDGTGGNNHAVDHYNQTNYPLVSYCYEMNFLHAELLGCY